MSKYQIEIGSPIDYEEVTASVIMKGEHLVLLQKEEGNDKIIVEFSSPIPETTKVYLTDFLEAIDAAKDSLLQTTTLIPQEQFPEGFNYPLEFLKVVNQKLCNLEPWMIIKDELLRRRFDGLKSRYPERTLIPFAIRLDNDDVACWEGSDTTSVVIIHDFASSGWEDRKVFPTFWDWFLAAVNDMIVHD